MGCSGDPMKNARRKRLLAAAMAVLLCTGCRAKPEPQPTPTPQTTLPPARTGSDWQSTVTFNGVDYQRRRNLKTVLLLGVDNADIVPGVGDLIGNNGRADAIMLFILDPDSETTQTLSVSRDTITDVDVYKGNGDYDCTIPSQITMQYAYGNSDLRSCFLMKRTVSRLLYNVPIDACLALKMDGIPTVVEELGGITLTFPEDYSYIDPAYRAGAQVTLDGPAAERFVRFRDITVSGTAEQRLGRQTWFMHEMFSQLKAKGNMEDTLEDLLDAAEDFIQSDVDAETLKMLADYTMLDETCKVPGASVAGEFHDEYHVDEEALQGMVIQLFYEPVP